MAQPDAELPGRLRVVGRTVEEANAAAEISLAAWRRGPRHGEFVELLGTRAYFKQSALTGKTSVRYALRGSVLRARLPRLAELENLRWLRDHGFHAPEPLAAGAWWRAGLPRFQFLFTRAVEGATTLASFLASRADASVRAKVLDELAREVARMHALGFVHRDLYPRNVLVFPGNRGVDPARVWFLDCWAGGPRPGLRGPAYDFDCLFQDGQISPEERERFRQSWNLLSRSALTARSASRIRG